MVSKTTKLNLTKLLLKCETVKLVGNPRSSLAFLLKPRRIQNKQVKTSLLLN